MNGKVKKAMAFLMAGILAAGSLAGCSSTGGESTTAGTQAAGSASEGTAGGAAGDYPNQAITGVSTFSTSSGTFLSLIHI